MLGELLHVEEDWTSVVDDIDRFGLDQGCPLVPLSQLHRNESAFATSTTASVSDQVYAGEEQK